VVVGVQQQQKAGKQATKPLLLLWEEFSALLSLSLSLLHLRQQQLAKPPPPPLLQSTDRENEKKTVEKKMVRSFWLFDDDDDAVIWQRVDDALKGCVWICVIWTSSVDVWRKEMGNYLGHSTVPMHTHKQSCHVDQDESQ
jgi:hypothetical protein